MNGKKYKSYMMIEDSKLPYLLVIPDEIKDSAELVVESLNREADKRGNIEGFDDRSIESAWRTARRIVASIKDAPVMIPMIPSREGEEQYQQLSKESIEGKSSEERMDLQCLEAIESAKRKVQELTGVNLSEKIFLSGYSASGVFAQRFSLIHPEIVDKCLVGGAVGSIPIPEDTLPYPCGIKDFEELFDKKFNADSYQKIQFAYYEGEHEAARPGEHDKSLPNSDMREQEKKEESHGKHEPTKLEQLENEQKELVENLKNKKREYEQNIENSKTENKSNKAEEKDV